MNIKSIVFSLILVNLKKKKSKFSYYYTGLDDGCSMKKALTASFVENYKGSHENTTYVYFAEVT